MSTTSKALLLFFALTLLACLSGYFAQSKPEAKLDEAHLALMPDHTITALFMQQFDTDGILVHALNTPYMVHIPGENKHWLKTPHILVMKNNQAPFTIDAEEMNYIPQTNLAETLSHVTVTQAGNTIQSEGMKAYLAENRLELLHQARAVYDPSHG